MEALLFTCCALLVEIHSLLVNGCKITRYSLQNSLVARCKNSLVTRCRSCSLEKITDYSLRNSLVTRSRAKNHWLLVAKFAFYSLLQITRYSLQKFIHHSLKQSQGHKVRWKCFQYSNLFPRAIKFKVIPSQHIKLKSVVSRTFSNSTIYNWVKTPQLLALSQRNE